MKNNFFESIDFKGGEITYNSFDINPLVPLSRQKFSLQQDMLQVRYDLYLIDVGWYPSLNTKGRFVIYLIYNCDWDEPIQVIEAKNLASLKVGLRKMIDRCEMLKSIVYGYE